jgi:hypothetical protein
MYGEEKHWQDAMRVAKQNGRGDAEAPAARPRRRERNNEKAMVELLIGRNANHFIVNNEELKAFEK